MQIDANKWRHYMKKNFSKGFATDDIDCLNENHNKYLVHELQIHQIELETQNEELK